MTAPVRVFLEADVKCYHCGHISGALRVDRGVANSTATFKAVGSDSEVAVASRSRLRCVRCGGPTFTDEFNLRREFSKIDFFEDRPRRGRPPKRLLEQQGVA